MSEHRSDWHAGSNGTGSMARQQTWEESQRAYTRQSHNALTPASYTDRHPILFGEEDDEDERNDRNEGSRSASSGRRSGSMSGRSSTDVHYRQASHQKGRPSMSQIFAGRQENPFERHRRDQSSFSTVGVGSPPLKSARRASEALAGIAQGSLASLPAPSRRRATNLGGSLRGGGFKRDVVVIALALAIIIYSRVSAMLPRPVSTYGACDPLSTPGYLRLNLTDPHSTHWVPLAAPSHIDASDDEATIAAKKRRDVCLAQVPDYVGELWRFTHGDDNPMPHFTMQGIAPYHLILHAPPDLRTPTLDASNVTVLASGKKSKGDDPLHFLRGKPKRPRTILLLGDSVDRNGLVHFCQLAGRNVSLATYRDANLHPPLPPVWMDLSKQHPPTQFDGWDQRGLPHMCDIFRHEDTVPDDEPYATDDNEESRIWAASSTARGRGKRGATPALRVVNGFHYGLDELDEFNTPDRTDWHGPGKIESRIDRLFIPFLEQIGGTDNVDLIQLQSGMWDLALWGFQDDKVAWSIAEPLSPEQLAWWQERMRAIIFHLRLTFPRARIILRMQHRTDDNDPAKRYITNLRAHQIRHLQRELARVEQLPVFDYGHVFEGYQVFQDHVHPHMNPGGVLYATNLLNQLRIAVEQKDSWQFPAIPRPSLRLFREAVSAFTE